MRTLFIILILAVSLVGINYYFDLGLGQFIKQYTPEQEEVQRVKEKAANVWENATGGLGGSNFFPSNPIYTSASTSAMTTLAGTGDLRVLASSTGTNFRIYAAFVNNCTDKIFLSMNNDKQMASNANEGIMINANGGSYEINANNMYYGAVRASSTSACELLVFEGRRVTE